MSDLDELYQELILDHTKRPRNFRAMEDATNVADGHNRLCGDKLRLYIKIAGDRIEDVAFQGEGCSISKSSASMMTDTGGVSVARNTPNDRTVRSWGRPSSSTAMASLHTQPIAMWAAPTA